MAISLASHYYQQANSAGLHRDLGQLERQIAALRQDQQLSDSAAAQHFDALRADLATARTDAAKKAGEVRLAARKQAELVAAQLSVKQEEHHKQLSQELGQVKDSAEQASAKLTEINGEVGNVKTEVASTRSELDKTVSELRRATGDLGVLSGLIATNSKELEALKELGERDYYQFSLSKKQAQQRVGDIAVSLKKADPKRNRFTIELVADDKRVEKKDRNVNEPVQFYVLSKARQPYELVVNEVKKDQIVGYISVPKLKLGRGSKA